MYSVIGLLVLAAAVVHLLTSRTNLEINWLLLTINLFTLLLLALATFKLLDFLILFLGLLCELPGKIEVIEIAAFAIVVSEPEDH